MKITSEAFKNLLEISSKNQTYHFDTNFAAFGCLNSLEHSRDLYPIFLNMMQEIKNPIIITSRQVCGYFISHDMLSGLFGKIEEITHVGELLQNNNVYRIISYKDNYCKSCGSPLIKEFCEYCGTGIKSNIGHLPIYVTPDYPNTDRNICVLANNDLNDGRVLYLQNMRQVHYF